MSGKFTVAYSPQAMYDLHGIYAYIAYILQVPRIAERQVGRIRREIRSLDTMPERHPLVNTGPGGTENVRRAVVGKYLILYIVDNDAGIVRVIRVVYGGQDIAHVLEDEE